MHSPAKIRPLSTILDFKTEWRGGWVHCTFLFPNCEQKHYAFRTNHCTGFVLVWRVGLGFAGEVSTNMCQFVGSIQMTYVCPSMPICQQTCANSNNIYFFCFNVGITSNGLVFFLNSDCCCSYFCITLIHSRCVYVCSTTFQWSIDCLQKLREWNGKRNLTFFCLLVFGET